MNAKQESQANGTAEPYFRKPQHIVGIILLPIIVLQQLRMIVSDPYFNPLDIGEIGLQSWFMLLGMSLWWFLLYGLLKKNPILSGKTRKVIAAAYPAEKLPLIGWKRIAHITLWSILTFFLAVLALLLIVLVVGPG